MAGTRGGTGDGRSGRVGIRTIRMKRGDAGTAEQQRCCIVPQVNVQMLES